MKDKIRKDYTLICSIMLLLSITVIIFYNQTLGEQKIGQQIARFILTFFLVIFTVLNKNWAKWILSVLSLFGGLLSLISSFALFSQNIIGLILILSMGIFYIFSGIYIIATRNKSISKSA